MSRSCLPLQLILILFIFFLTRKPTDFSSNGCRLQCIYVCVLFCVCPSLCVIAAWPIECQSLLWVSLTDFNNGCIHFGLGSRLQAPGGRETVNKPQLAASPGVTQQPGCLLYIFFSGQHGVRIAERLRLRKGLGRGRS